MTHPLHRKSVLPRIRLARTSIKGLLGRGRAAPCVSRPNSGAREGELHVRRPGL